MINELKDSLLNEFEKRFKNPFLWAFVLAWIFWNWDFLYVSLFLDEKYVSLLPQIWNTFSTKFEYIKNNNLVNIYKFVIYPLSSSFILILFIEWLTTWLNLFISRIKNKILWYELLTKEQSLKIKNDLVESKHNTNELLSKKNEEILLLNSKISELDSKIDNEVSIKLKKVEEKNLKRIEELEDNLLRSETISSERLDKNKKIDNENKFLNKTLNELKNRENELLSENDKIKNELLKLNSKNNELEKNLNNLDKPLEKKYELEYEEFKKSYFFEWFDDFIDTIESQPYELTKKFYWKDIKFLEVKWIIEKNSDENWYNYYSFTNKWNKFVEFFLDNYQWNFTNKKIQKNNNIISEDIEIEDIPF